MVILKPDLTEKEQEEVFEKVAKKIGDLNGEVNSSKIWAKERNFYYFLRGREAAKKKYYKGAYWLINFTVSTDSLPKLRELIRLEERVLRSIIINQVKKQPVKK